jgi:hypothetical protein
MLVILAMVIMLSFGQTAFRKMDRYIDPPTIQFILIIVSVPINATIILPSRNR